MPEYPTVTVYSSLTNPDDPHVFVDCRWKVDETGSLHIFRAPSDGDRGGAAMVAAFGAGSWSLVHADADVSVSQRPRHECPVCGSDARTQVGKALEVAVEKGVRRGISDRANRTLRRAER